MLYAVRVVPRGFPPHSNANGDFDRAASACFVAFVRRSKNLASGRSGTCAVWTMVFDPHPKQGARNLGRIERLLVARHILVSVRDSLLVVPSRENERQAACPERLGNRVDNSVAQLDVEYRPFRRVGTSSCSASPRCTRGIPDGFLVASCYRLSGARFVGLRVPT
jgi:hypothetical protein